MVPLNILIAFGLTLIAGLSTGIGSILAFFANKTNIKFLSVALGFSAGVMIYVSFIEIFFTARDYLQAYFGDIAGNWWTVFSFFIGILIIAIIDKLVPSFENPHEMHKVEEVSEPRKHKTVLFRTGVFSAIAIAIHNFPEGLATFTSAIKDPALGVSIAVAIAIHNIPEGIASGIGTNLLCYR